VMGGRALDWVYTEGDGRMEEGGGDCSERAGVIRLGMLFEWETVVQQGSEH
jgi:hypothetical protein